VTHELQLLCGIDVLLLRLDHPSHSLWSGDVDNRLKSIIFALRMPHVNDGYTDIHPVKGQNPLFCLLEDDKLLTRVSVETDKLLERTPAQDQSYAHVMITVNIRPENLTYGNIGF
jgi:hypothetical protein